MKSTRTAVLAAMVIACATAFASAPADKTASTAAQGTSLASLLKGSGYPLTMKPADLPADFVAAKISTEAGGGAGGLMDMFMNPMMIMMGALGGAGSGLGDAEAAAALAALDLTWSKGEITTADGTNFLVTYKGSLDLKDMAALDKKNSLSDVVLRLNLIRVDSIKSVVPRPDMTKEQFVTLMSTKFPKKTTKELGKTDTGA